MCFAPRSGTSGPVVYVEYEKYPLLSKQAELIHRPFIIFIITVCRQINHPRQNLQLMAKGKPVNVTEPSQLFILTWRLFILQPLVSPPVSLKPIIYTQKVLEPHSGRNEQGLSGRGCKVKENRRLRETETENTGKTGKLKVNTTSPEIIS